MSVAHHRERCCDGAWHGAVSLVYAFAVTQFGLHAWFAVSAGDPRVLLPHVLAWLLDVFVLIVGALILFGSSIALVRCGVRDRWTTFACHLLVFATGLWLASYPGLLAEFLAFPTNIFRADGASVWFFVTEYLGWRGLWPLLASGAAVSLASRLRWRPALPRRRTVVVVTAVLFATATFLHPAPQPLLYAVQDSARDWLFGGKRAVPSLSRPTAKISGAEASTNDALPLEASGPFGYDHILILVFEGVTAASFEREFLTRSDGYYASVRDRSTYFSGYHTTNLDSYTSLIAMLTAVQVPYRAYADPWSYQSVNEAPNIVATLRRRGLHTLYLSSGDYTFIDNTTGAVLANHGRLDALSVYKKFQSQLSTFAARFQR
ncbi:MAG: hypothetical protein NTY19_40820 [Planctomycetota bacterium]|nr:hypothetical protein [Planctomycetota bacterium]